MSFLLDTNILSEIRKGERADAGVRRWFATVEDDELYLSVLTIGEIRLGVERVRRRDATGARTLEAWLRAVTRRHQERILPVDAEVCEAWALLNVPDPVPVVDGLIAATAQVNGLRVVTRNTADFAPTGVPLVDPFQR